MKNDVEGVMVLTINYLNFPENGHNIQQSLYSVN